MLPTVHKGSLGDIFTMKGPANPFAVSVVNMTAQTNSKGCWIDFRCPISNLPKVDSMQLEELISLAQEEGWKENISGSNTYNKIKHYLQYYFYRVTSQSIVQCTMLSYHLITSPTNPEKMLLSGIFVDRKPSVILFDTGLLTKDLERIIACITGESSLGVDCRAKAFIYSTDKWKKSVQKTFDKWTIQKFLPESVIANSAKMKLLFGVEPTNDLPSIPKMFNTVTDLIYDPALPISDKFDAQHLFGESTSDVKSLEKRRKRIPEKYWNLSTSELLDRIKFSLRRTETLVKRQPRLAVPIFFYDHNSVIVEQEKFGENNLIVPVPLDPTTGGDIIALVLRKVVIDRDTTTHISSGGSVSINKSYYQPITILSPKMVSDSTRTIQKPDQIWLVEYINNKKKTLLPEGIPSSVVTMADGNKSRDWFPQQ